jgi:hypothetical protein
MVVGQVILKFYYPNEADALAAVDALLAKSLYAEAVRTPLGGWAAAVHVEAADDDLDRVRAEIDAIARPLRRESF